VFAAVHSRPGQQFALGGQRRARGELGADDQFRTEVLDELDRRGGHVLGDGAA
jgi:hypothetical protein